jgi:hypothetical protein
MSRLVPLALTLAMTGPSLGQTNTCETQGDRRHCFDHHGYLSTEERSGDYVHGWGQRGPSVDDMGAWRAHHHVVDTVRRVRLRMKARLFRRLPLPRQPLRLGTRLRQNLT